MPLLEDNAVFWPQSFFTPSVVFAIVYLGSAMETARHRSGVFGKTAVFILELILALTLAGCGYALHPITLPSVLRLRIVTKSPQVYAVRLRINAPHDYDVPADGRVSLNIPAYRAACSMYLFGFLKLPNRSDPYSAKTLDVFAGGKTARQLSLKTIAALPLDSDGYHLLKLPSPK